MDGQVDDDVRQLALNGTTGKENLFLSHYLNTINTNLKIVQVLDDLKSVWTPDDNAFKILQEISVYMDLQYRVFVVATNY